MSRPMSVLFAVRPSAATTSSATNSPAAVTTVTSAPRGYPSSVRDTGPRRTAVTAVPVRTSTPTSANRCATRSPANGSWLPSRRSPRSRIVTCAAPNPRSQVADSHATTPPPRTTTRRGTSWTLVTSREVHGAASRSPSMGGRAAPDPVARTTACRAVSVRVVPSASSTATAFSPASRPCPRTRVIPVLSSHCTCELSSWPCTKPSRRASTAARSSSPFTACAAPSTWAAASRASSGRSIALLGMHAQYEHSPPTSSRSTSAAVRPEPSTA